MNRDTGEATFPQQLVQLNGTSYALYEDDDLVKVQSVEKIVELAILLRFFQSNEVLLKPVKREFGFVIDEDFERL
jgi:hypothetical protein